jgi:hypothetical protein
VSILSKKGVQRHVDMQYGATLEPIIEATIARKIDQATARTAHLALDAFSAAEEARILTLYILRFLLGEEDLLAKIVEDARTEAQASLKGYAYQEAAEDEQQPRQEVVN